MTPVVPRMGTDVTPTVGCQLHVQGTMHRGEFVIQGGMLGCLHKGEAICSSRVGWHVYNPRAAFFDKRRRYRIKSVVDYNTTISVELVQVDLVLVK